jgi:hypothetical protein
VVTLHLTRSFLASRGDLYRTDNYSLDPITGIVTGNPTKSNIIADIMTTIRNKKVAEGGMRNHADAITIDQMKLIFEWSESVVPSGSESQALEKNLEERNLVAFHLQMRAFMATGFTLWTR